MPDTRAQRSARYRAAHLEQRRASDAAQQAARRSAHPDRAHAVAAAYRAAHPERVRARNAAYRDEHPEALEVYRVAHYAAHRDQEIARADAYRRAHPEWSRARNATWRKAHPEQVNAIAQRHRARKLAAFAEDVDVAVLAGRDRNRCGICGLLVERSARSVDHILPLAAGGEHSYANTRLTHVRCNIRRQHRGAAQLRMLS